MAIPEELKKALGNPGIWGYCKETEYEGFMKQLDERGYFHDLERSGGKVAKVKATEFEYRDSIPESDYSHELFTDNDIIVRVWCVSKEYLKPTL